MKEKPNRIAEIRHKLGISQEKLAEELNVTQASVSLYENGSNIPLDILIKLSRYFNVTVDSLLGLSKDTSILTEHVTENEYSILKFYRDLPPQWKLVANKIVETVLQGP